MKRQFLIIISNDGTFQNGKRWVDEYPDALVFRDREEAVKEIQKYSMFDSVSVYVNYGLETERKIEV